MIVADVARGDGKDNSAFHIFELETMEVIGEYVGKPTPDDFADILYNVAAEYGNPMLVIENNNIGYAVLKKLLDKGYPNIYHSSKGDHQYVDPAAAQVAVECYTGIYNFLKNETFDCGEDGRVYEKQTNYD